MLLLSFSMNSQNPSHPKVPKYTVKGIKKGKGLDLGEANLGAEPPYIKQGTLKRWHKQTEGNKTKWGWLIHSYTPLIF